MFKIVIVILLCILGFFASISDPNASPPPPPPRSASRSKQALWQDFEAQERAILESQEEWRRNNPMIIELTCGLKTLRIYPDGHSEWSHLSHPGRLGNNLSWPDLERPIVQNKIDIIRAEQAQQAHSPRQTILQICPPFLREECVGFKLLDIILSTPNYQQKLQQALLNDSISFVFTLPYTDPMVCGCKLTPERCSAIRWILSTPIPPAAISRVDPTILSLR